MHCPAGSEWISLRVEVKQTAVQQLRSAQSWGDHLAAPNKCLAARLIILNAKTPLVVGRAAPHLPMVESPKSSFKFYRLECPDAIALAWELDASPLSS